MWSSLAPGSRAKEKERRKGRQKGGRDRRSGDGGREWRKERKKGRENEERG